MSAMKLSPGDKITYEKDTFMPLKCKTLLQYDIMFCPVKFCLCKEDMKWCLMDRISYEKLSPRHYFYN